MGYMKSDAVELRIVSQAVGRGHSTVGRQYPKMKIFLLEDKRGIILTPSPTDPKDVVRETIEVQDAIFRTRSKKMSITLQDGEVLTVDTSGCGCGSAITAAAPVEGSFWMVGVRAPEWYSEVFE